MYSCLRPVLFRANPESAHAITLRLLQAVGGIPPLAWWISRLYRAPEAPLELFGLRFPNRLGLAAGYDKDGLAWRGLAALGFGHIEIGTVTPRPQPGNPRPRLFRLVEDEALINRLGFPSRGAIFAARRLRGPRPKGLVLGVNLGINKDTPIERAADDYSILMQKFTPLADYLTVNISSPNTLGLRNLHQPDLLSKLLDQLNAVKQKPLLVKVSPDLTLRDLDLVLSVLIDKQVDGVIATNTTVTRPNLVSSNHEEAGGLSGRPLAAVTRRTIGHVYTHTQGKLPIIASGGILSREDADAAINAGASLVQIFTGLVYKGTGLIREILGLENHDLELENQRTEIGD